MISKLDANFLARMEMVLDLYEQPYDEERPVVCLDERPGQMLSHVNEPLETSTATTRHDYEYERKGTYSAFLMVEPLTGWRHVDVRAHRKDEDFAAQLLYLDEFYKEAEQITVVLDNLNTHRLETLWKVVEPQEALRLAKRFRLVFTPVHGSWLNMAELELSVLERCCLNNQRLATLEEVREHIGAWEHRRNKEAISIDWGFTVNESRAKFSRFYEQEFMC